MNERALFRAKFPDDSGLALYQLKTTFVKISATFVCAMDLKLKKHSARAGPQGNGSWNLGRANDWCRV